MDIRQPPSELKEDVSAYLDRQFKIVEEEIDSVNGIIIVQTLPAKPREGRLYFLKGHGFYFYLFDAWRRFVTEDANGSNRKWDNI